MANWRPSTLADIIGQDVIKRRMNIWVKARTERDEAMPHAVLYGPPGTGKTTLSRAVAHERKVEHVETTGDRLQTPKDIMMLLSQTNDCGYRREGPELTRLHGVRTSPTILFIDEIHRMSKEATEALYHPIEDGFVKNHRRQAGRDTWYLPGFTLIGATTDAGALLQPLARRVEMLYMSPYSDTEMRLIVRAHADKAQEHIQECGHNIIHFSNGAVDAITQRSRNNPSAAVHLVSEMVDWATAEDVGRIDGEYVTRVMEAIGINATGLNDLDRRILRTLQQINRPMGIDNLAHSMGEMSTNIGLSEAYLVSIGAIIRGPRGREISEEGLRLIREDNTSAGGQ